MRKRKWWLVIPLVLVIIYLMGPKPSSPVYAQTMPAVPADPVSLQEYVSTQESAHKLKPDNQARIVWANNSLKQKTEVAIVYLHGFSASQAEGDPIHRTIAKEFGCNLYLARLAEHGIDTTEPLLNLTPDKYWESAKKALAIGRQLGDKVILMGTSTGGTLALQLAANYHDVYALVLLSPNIAIDDPNAWLLNNPWGLQIARLVKGSNYIESDDKREIYKQYWCYKYRIEGAVALEELLETSMSKKTFQKITQPALVLYYYKDPVFRDSTVKVSAIQEMFKELGTEASLKKEVAMPNTGDHVIGSYIKSKDLKSVQWEIENFMTNVLHLKRSSPVVAQ